MTATKLSARILVMSVIALVAIPTSMAQSLISGDIAGTITDPNHAVVPGIPVILRSLDTGATQQTTTSDTGSYQFSLLKPGQYQVSVKSSGFAPAERHVTVQLGQTTTADMALRVFKTAETVEVSGAVIPMLTKTPSPSTSFSRLEMEQLPNPGEDLTNIAQSVPGAVMNNTGGLGNFTVYGLPATSVLFTINGEDYIDPFYNVNMSGATNLAIGSNEIQEATVVTNAYSGEYGQYAGTQVTYVTKSGSNAFHGNAQYWWNGRAMNANDWMNNNGVPQTPRPFSNANQWAASVGGPIMKNKTFFFVNTEGVRFVLPNVISTTIPTADFASAALANVEKLQPAEAPLYQRMFQLFANATGSGRAVPIPNSQSCTELELPGFDPATQACAARFQSTPDALAWEWVVAVRIDQKLGQKDQMFGRYKLDHGLQPNYQDPISPDFNVISQQPWWDIQLQETHVFSPNATNEFTAAGSHFVFLFAQNQPLASDTFPARVTFGGAVPFSSFNPMTSFPAGRRNTQYQFIDNFSLVRGRHSLKFGANFRRYDISDHNFFFNYPGVFFSIGSNALQQMVEGFAGSYRQSDNLASNVPVAFWGVGAYAQDEWKIRSNLTVTLGLRYEYNSNPVCQINCFANFKTSWNSLASTTSPDPGSVPYTQDIAHNLHQGYPGVDGADFSPRVGFSWSPYSNGKTVISAGFGLFYDAPPAAILDNFLANPPVAVGINVQPAQGTLAFDPGPNGSYAIFEASAAAFNQGFASGQTYSQIAAQLQQLGVPFAPPNFHAVTGTIHNPRWQEWSVHVQQELDPATALIFSYVGNHGIRIPHLDVWYNAYNPGFYPSGLLPSSAPVPNYGTVSQVLSGALSNYNGITISLRRNFANWFAAHANYTWGHNLDEASNGGLFNYGDSLLRQLCPGSLRQCNYGSSDYDVRNSLNADFVVHPQLHTSNGILKGLLGGWEWSGKVFWRNGLPFSIFDGNTSGGIPNGAGIPTLGYPILPGNAPGQRSCGRGAASAAGTATPCLDAAAFINSGADSFTTYPGFSPQRRNQYVGPHFFDFDMALFKTFQLTERVQLGIGAQAYNVFNHPNFSNPDNSLGDATFGQISSMQNMPTSPYGAGLGFDTSVRVVQISGKIIF